MHVLRFSVADTAYAVAVDRVVEIAPRVAISPLPDTPAFIEGIFAYRQASCVAIALRRRFGLPLRKPSLDEHIIVVRGRQRILGLVVDRVIGDELVERSSIENPEVKTKLVAGVVPLADGVLLIHDVDALLDDEQEALLDARLEARS